MMFHFILLSSILCCLCFWHCESLKFVPPNLQLHTERNSMPSTITKTVQKNPALQVSLPQGIVQGRIKRTIDRKLRYFSFEGIPYAEPPLGNLRFRVRKKTSNGEAFRAPSGGPYKRQPPVSASNWTGVLNGSRRDFTSCIQVTPSVFNDLIESEDCLYINIFTPVQEIRKSGDGELLPVMVWLYGGAFLMGSANSTYFGPDYLLEEGVVVAHLNYRLASFGFLSTEDLESPGNYGLKDQHLALHWLKNNIKYFGGDPRRITIFGESAGSVSVQYQLMYRKNEGLFQGAISESGSTLCIWSFQRYARKIAFDLGRAAGIVTDDSKELLDYLRSLSADKLKVATMKTSIKNTIGIISGIPFAPTIEPDHPEAFIVKKPHQLLKEGDFIKVPYIIGFNSAEASLAKQALNMASPLLRFIDLEPSVLVPSGMNAGKQTAKVGKLIKDFYFRDSSKSVPDQYLQYVDDGYFYRPMLEAARLFDKSTPTFVYCFSYKGLAGRKAVGYSRIDEYEGVVHTEEMAYIWARRYLAQPSDIDKVVTRRMVKLWTNFAKTGSPTPGPENLLENINWPTFSNGMLYLDIDTDLSIKQHYRNESMAFWKELYKNYGRPPYDTY